MLAPNFQVLGLLRPQLQGIVKQMLDEAQEAVQARHVAILPICLSFLSNGLGIF